MKPKPSDLKKMKEWAMKKGLESIKAMILRGEVTSEQALYIIAKESEQFSDNAHTIDYKKFKQHSGLIYSKEPFFNISYPCDSGTVYNFQSASEHDVHTLFKLYKLFSGKEYDSASELLEIMKGLLNKKRILELGCGPGFNLKVLQDLGARVSGMEIRAELIGGIPDIDIRCGDAEHLDDLFQNEQFDIIYSRDLFCSAVLDPKKSRKMIAKTYILTKDGGTGLHQITYEKLSLQLFLLHAWSCARQAGRDPKETEELFWDMPEDEQEDALYTNRSSLDLQDVVTSGFKLREYSIENGELNIIINK